MVWQNAHDSPPPLRISGDGALHLRAMVEVEVQAYMAKVDLLHRLLHRPRRVRPLQVAAVAQTLVGSGIQGLHRRKSMFQKGYTLEHG